MSAPALYLDEPFAGQLGGDKNRSRFLWKLLQTRYQAEWAEVRTRPLAAQATGGPKPSLSLDARPARFWSSQSVHRFDAASRARFREHLEAVRPRFLFSRFYSAWELQCIADASPGRLPVIVDVDMLSSRLVELAWRKNPSFRNRYFLFETWKLRALERRLFRRPFLFLMTNPAELAGTGLQSRLIGGVGKAVVVPNFMPLPERRPPGCEKPVILFFGSLDSAANVDAVRYLVRDILPRIQNELQARGLEVHLVGKNPVPAIRELVAQARCPQLKLVGEVASVDNAIAEARLILLPIRVASGTRTRILEAGALGKAVVTTPLGAEGLDLTPEALSLHESAAGLAGAVTGLLREPKMAARLGEQLQKQCLALYHPDKIAADLDGEIEAFISRWQDRYL